MDSTFTRNPVNNFNDEVVSSKTLTHGSIQLLLNYLYSEIRIGSGATVAYEQGAKPATSRIEWNNPMQKSVS